MKFTRFKFEKEWDWFFILPSINLFINDMRIRDKNIRLCVDWLGWHFMWLWVDETKRAY